MMSMAGDEAELDHYLFFLATELGVTLGTILDMPEVELAQWRAYHTAQHAYRNQGAPQ